MISFRPLPCEVSRLPFSRAQIGLVALAGDSIIEPELRTFLPEDVALYVTRVPFAITDLDALEEHLPSAVKLLVPGERIDVVAFGCTAASMSIGADRVAAALQRARPACRVTNPVQASLDALAHVGAKRIALLTPYPDDVNAVVAHYLAAHVEIVSAGTLRASRPSRSSPPPSSSIAPTRTRSSSPAPASAAPR
jgi:maleate isomerase